jgi:hypothetical protein
MTKRIVLLFLVIVVCKGVSSQSITNWGVSYISGKIIAHSKDVENTKGAAPFGLQAEYSWRKTDSSRFKNFYGLPRQGLSLCYTNYDNAVLGSGVAASYFFEPQIRFNKKSGVNFRTSAGVGYLSRPNSAGNNSYSTALSFYLGVGIQPYLQLSRHWSLGMGSSYRHISNGGVKLPNKGINWLTGEINLMYYPQPQVDIEPLLNRYRKQAYTKTNRWDVYVFGAIRSIDNADKKTYPLIGAGLMRSWQTGKTHAITTTLNLYHDGSVPQQLRNDGLPSKSAWRASAEAGHEFLWARIIFRQQIGVYLFDKTPYNPAWYHRWALLYRMNNRLMAGVSIKAHKQVANFTDLRLTFSL